MYTTVQNTNNIAEHDAWIKLQLTPTHIILGEDMGLNRNCVLNMVIIYIYFVRLAALLAMLLCNESWIFLSPLICNDDLNIWLNPRI